MPKRKVAAKSDRNRKDGEDAVCTAEDDQLSDAAYDIEQPAKRGKGRRKAPSKPAETRLTEEPSGQSALVVLDHSTTRKTRRRWKPPGSQETEGKDEIVGEPNTVTSNDELDALEGASKLQSKHSKRVAASARKKLVRQVQTTEPQGTPNSQRYEHLKKHADQDIDDDAVSEAQHIIRAADVPLRKSLSASPGKEELDRTVAERTVQDSSLKQKYKELPDAEDTGDLGLMHKLSDLTKKYEILEQRYDRLKKIGVVEANANMEQLRKHCETITEDSNNLISSLQRELEAQTDLAKQSWTLRKQLQERDAEITQLKDQAEESASILSSAQSEVKVLQAKLTAARSTASSLEGAAVKPLMGSRNTSASRAQSAEAAQATQLAQLKEDLYCDLTGLIVRDIKRRESDYLYDCIQTGTNGTLHFKLAVPQNSAASFESVEFQYAPLLDENRDRDLVDILPDYLTVDITFSRQQASKFYTRVIDALMKRPASRSA